MTKDPSFWYGGNPMTRFLYLCVVAALSIAMPTPAPATVTVSKNLDITVTSGTAAFFVATTGSDSNPGTLAAPFATLGKAQTAMRASSTIKTAYIRAGTYNRTQMLTLTSADDGETWSYYPPDGYNTAILDATGMVFDNCANHDIVFIQGGSNITINGLTFQNFTNGGGQIPAGVGAGGAIAIHGGSGNYPDIQQSCGFPFPSIGTPARTNLIENNIVTNVGAGANNAYPYGWFSAISTWGDVHNTLVTHNVIHDVRGQAIEFTLYNINGSVGGPNGGLNNSVMSYNVAYNLNQATGTGDLGGYYVIDRSASSAGIQIANNYLRDPAGNATSSKGVYLDDGASGITVSGNVLTGRVDYQIFNHGGSSVAVTNNIIDIGTVGNEWSLAYQDAGVTSMTGNTISGNIHIASLPGSGNSTDNLQGDVYFSFPTFPTYPVVNGNDYWNFLNSQALPNQGDIADTNPAAVNPQLTCWTYNIAGGSPVYNPPTNFPVQPAAWGTAGFWGPPGYVIPHTGTAPSSPHSC